MIKVPQKKNKKKIYGDLQAQVQGQQRNFSL